MGLCSTKQRNTTQWTTDGIDEDNEVSDESVQLVFDRQDVPTNSIAHLSPMYPSLVASGWDDGLINIVDWNSRIAVLTFAAHEKSVNRLVFAPKTNSLYSCSRDTTISRHSINLQNEIPTSKLSTFKGHTLSVSAIAIDDAESMLASGGRDTAVSIWDVATFTRLQQTIISQNVVTCMKWVPEATNLIAQGGEDLCLRVWDTRSWKAPAQIIEGYVYFPLSLDISDDGNYILTSSKGFNGVGCEGRVWDRRTGRQICEMTGHIQDTTACTFIPQCNAYAITASKDSSIRVWNARDGCLISTSHHPNAGMFTSVSCLPPDKENVARIFTSSFVGNLTMYSYNIDSSSIEIKI
ncbi:hypothetical protein THRCLA_09839 [Thraustotheca clavata]|uniref:Uncharacterized protein n=1 Tax=Thraustotheca clavata TaxID=74557 RepID=A0A1V9YTZ2_9STRA|nr:hypothetical protein THRCLA_09839 [Thraustotheca clavata]